MTLSKFTDYSFRCLIYLSKNKDKKTNVEELSKVLNLSEHHIKKIIHRLAKKGFIKSSKGRNGGITLGKSPKDINLKDLICYCEDFSKIVECNKNSKCIFIENECMLKSVCNRALESFLEEFEKYNLEDIINFN